MSGKTAPKFTEIVARNSASDNAAGYRVTVVCAEAASAAPRGIRGGRPYIFRCRGDRFGWEPTLRYNNGRESHCAGHRHLSARDPMPEIAPQMLSEDRACIRCGYNLRGLVDEGNCPECGRPVSDSLRGDVLEHADPQGLDKLRFGCALKLWNMRWTSQRHQCERRRRSRQYDRYVWMRLRGRSARVRSLVRLATDQVSPRVCRGRPIRTKRCRYAPVDRFPNSELRCRILEATNVYAYVRKES